MTDNTELNLHDLLPPGNMQAAEVVMIGDQKVEWQLDEYGSWNLHLHMPDGSKGYNDLSLTGMAVHAFIQPRPLYCDRGHWVFNVDGPLGLDGADSFPRYYMDLTRAKQEVADFLRWRLYKQ